MQSKLDNKFDEVEKSQNHQIFNDLVNAIGREDMINLSSINTPRELLQKLQTYCSTILGDKPKVEKTGFITDPPKLPHTMDLLHPSIMAHIQNRRSPECKIVLITDITTRSYGLFGDTKLIGYVLPLENYATYNKTGGLYGRGWYFAKNKAQAQGGEMLKLFKPFML